MATNGKQSKSLFTRISDVGQEPLKTLAPLKGYESVPLVPLEAAAIPLSACVPGIEGFVEMAKKQCRNYKLPAGLTIDQAASIALYTMETSSNDPSVYRALNSILRSEDKKLLPPWYLYIKLLLTGLSYFPSAHQHIYRGVASSLYKNYVKDSIVTWWTFSSCATEIDVLQIFLPTKGARTMFTIECDSGKDISCLSDFPDEKEVLLLPETQFRVIAILDNGNELHTIQLRETRSPLSIPPPINQSGR